MTDETHNGETDNDGLRNEFADKPWKSRSIIDSFHNAFEGLYYVFKTQKSMRVQSVFVALVLLAAWGFGVSHVELVVLLLTMITVLVAEVFNTAIECVIDVHVEGYHEQARIIKDIAAAGVLLCSLASVLIGMMIFVNNPNFMGMFQIPPEFPSRPVLGPMQIVLVGMLLLALIVVWVKRATGWRSFLTGGLVSGHTALGFMIAASIVFVTRSPAVASLALALALLLAQSRLQADIHKLHEVALGALLGLLLAFILFGWPIVI